MFDSRQRRSDSSIRRNSTTHISQKRTATTARAPPPRPVAPVVSTVVPFMRHEHLEINVPRFNLNKFLSKYGYYALFGSSAGNEESTRIARDDAKVPRAGPGGGENREDVRQCPGLTRVPPGAGRAGAGAATGRAGGDPPCALRRGYCEFRAFGKFGGRNRRRSADARVLPAEAEPSCSMPPRSGRSGLFLPYRVRPQLSAMAHSTHPPNC